MELVQVIPTAIGVVAFIGVAFLYLRGAADKGTIESLTRSNTALKEELGIETGKREGLEARVATLEAEKEVLVATVTQAHEVKQLQTTLDNHHVAAMNGQGAQLEVLRDILAAVGGAPNDH